MGLDLQKKNEVQVLSKFAALLTARIGAVALLVTPATASAFRKQSNSGDFVLSGTIVYGTFSLYSHVPNLRFQ